MTIESENSASTLDRYNKIRNRTTLNKGVSYKIETTESTELPNVEMIVLAVDQVIEQFPYRSIEEFPVLDLQDDLILSLQEQLSEKEETLSEEQKEQLLSQIILAKKQDSIVITKAEANYQAMETIKAKEMEEMIKSDFPTLSDAQIEENIDLIEDYYAINLEHTTFEKIAENEKEFTSKSSKVNKPQKTSLSIEEAFDEYVIKQCTYGKLVLHDPYYLTQYVNFSYAFYKAAYYADLYSERRYGSLTVSNTRRDAYRHMLWNAMLCQTYYTVSSKSRRTRFAYLVTDARENGCKTSNDPDGKAMDIHNNALGRQVWDDNTSYRKLGSLIVGLRKPSITFLTNEIKNVIESKGCFIVKIKNDNVLPNKLLSETQTPEQIKTKIENTASDIPVYFEGTIAPSKYEASGEYSYSSCDMLSDVMDKEGIDEEEALDYIRERYNLSRYNDSQVYNFIVANSNGGEDCKRTKYVKIDACYKL